MNIDELIPKWQIEYKKGFTKPLILMILSEQDSHPYELAKIIRKKSKEQIEIATTNIYPILKNLKDLGLVTRFEEPNSTRTVYKITETGRLFVAQLNNSLEDFFSDVLSIIHNLRGKRK
ncbi:MAG: hypothetical protein HeimC3_32810 [Candidatus Heimdallarchaeota archaeon LC_3]|nr:MAG: hypothetical protein HeimC3_32810 [Candidatus Heimdallarchaeota archaeon LC_3]